jgi:hypothetical protein
MRRRAKTARLQHKNWAVWEKKRVARERAENQMKLARGEWRADYIKSAVRIHSAIFNAPCQKNERLRAYHIPQRLSNSSRFFKSFFCFLRKNCRCTAAALQIGRHVLQFQH